MSSSILVVDDDPGVLDVVSFMLRREGFEVDGERDGTAALSAAREKSYDIVILDVMLPYVSGYELLAAIRKSPAWARVPVLMLTSKSREADVVRALDGGANDYITKPFQPAELKARIRRLVPAT